MTTRDNIGGNETEKGAGAIQTLGYFFLLAALFFALASAGAIMRAKHHAQAAADLGAIAGARAIVRGETPDSACSYASRIAHNNHSTLLSCEIVGEKVALQVQSQPSLAALPAVHAHAVAAPDDY